MIGKLLEKVTGRDDLERVAYKENLDRLNDYLKTRKVWIPRRPKHLLDPATLTPDELLKRIRRDLEELQDAPFEPWILNVAGKKRLPVFSNQARLEVFAKRIAQDMKKAFSVASVEALLPDVARTLDVDFADLNLFSKKSWEIGIRPLR